MAAWCSSLFHVAKSSLCYREKYYTAIKDDARLNVKLSGSWETVVGEQDTFCEFVVSFDGVQLSSLTAGSAYPRV